MNRRASCVGTFEVFEAAHVALRTLLAFSQPVNCIFWPIGMLNWLVAASKLHKHRETCCTAEWPFYSFLILCSSLVILCHYSKKFLSASLSGFVFSSPVRQSVNPRPLVGDEMCLKASPSACAPILLCVFEIYIYSKVLFYIVRDSYGRVNNFRRLSFLSAQTIFHI